MRNSLARALPGRYNLCRTTTTSFIPSTVRLSSTSAQSPATSTTITRNDPPASSSQKPLTSRPYLINLTPSNNYPVYPRTKAAGQSKFTLIKHIDGDKRAFIQDLVEGTGIPRENVVLQPVTGHVQVKGFHVEELKKWLKEAFGEPHKAREPVDAVAP